MMEAIERVVPTNDWITLIFVLSLFLLVFARAFFLSRFQNFIILPFNNKYIFLYNKKGRLTHGFHIALSLFMFLNLSLFILFTASILFDQQISPGGSLLLVSGGGLLAYFLLKIGMQLAGGLILEFSKITSSLIFKKMTYLNYSALVMFIANLLLGYVTGGSKVIVLISISLILLINSIGWISILKIHQKLIATHIFYFILYLCTLEFAPFLIIANLLND
jgi:hypothetical protein